MEKLVAIDVETSGVDPFEHQLMSIAFVPIDNPELAKCFYVKHEAPIIWSDIAYEYFLGYKEDWTKKSEPPKKVLTDIEDYIISELGGFITPVTHNGTFDMSFFRQLVHQSGMRKLNSISHRIIDTHSLLHILVRLLGYPHDIVSSEAAFSFFGIKYGNDRHTALGDALATRLLYLKIMEILSERTKLNRRHDFSYVHENLTLGRG